MADLLALSKLIADGVAAIQSKCDARNTPFPPLDSTYTPQSDAIRMEVIADTLPIIAAANQLIATLQVPQMYAVHMGCVLHISAAWTTVTSGHVIEILREAGPQGAHVNDIAARNGMDPSKLARLLRICATYHLFREVSPDVFTNNRISSAVDTGKSVDDILAHPEDKHVGTTGSSTLAEITTDYGKTAFYLPDVLLDPKTASSEEVTETAFNRGFRTDLSWFKWLHQPENAYRKKRFGLSMTGLSHIGNKKEIINGFDWAGLPEGSIIVDVGGGIGTCTECIYDEYKHLKFVIQDREEVIADTTEVWKARRPDALISGAVTLQPHDFFTEQPVKNATVFFLRAILHDWPTAYAARILSHLRAAAGPHTTLVVADNIIRYACPDEGPYQDIPGTETKSPPAPLLANYGVASGLEYNFDLFMLAHFNAEERTIRRFVDLLGQAGWKLDRVYREPGDHFPRLIASPA
ncbi:S-adenosyl-L-methionine-dependent methyltransferase [Obba rivulosa]|uniref:S-adenosyl-L-methionine-dependent methyltransferase n=1 Tax=Obba rivulosa TaxID=1052685 RepID=A0A8E2DRP3_9APHY|nr:S-adenosyl-L-methionine-dependent methyltransferase [Obba rivulosa]